MYHGIKSNSPPQLRRRANVAVLLGCPRPRWSFRDLVIKDSKTMIMMRERDVPLRTKEGGQTWAR